MNDAQNHVKTAIRLLGSEARLAAASGVSQVSINKAKRRVANGGRVSAELAVAIEKATNQAVTRSQLRPDLWPEAGDAA